MPWIPLNRYYLGGPDGVRALPGQRCGGSRPCSLPLNCAGYSIRIHRRRFRGLGSCHQPWRRTRLQPAWHRPVAGVAGAGGHQVEATFRDARCRNRNATAVVRIRTAAVVVSAGGAGKQIVLTGSFMKKYYLLPESPLHACGGAESPPRNAARRRVSSGGRAPSLRRRHAEHQQSSDRAASMAEFRRGQRRDGRIPAALQAPSH